MTEAAAIPLSPIAVPHSSRPEPMSNEAVLNTTESGRAAVTTVPVSEIPSTDIRSDIQSNEPQPGQIEVESKRFLNARLAGDAFLLFYGFPPVSLGRALKSERRKSLGITPYRIIMTAVAGLGIPTAVLSFRGGSALASFIISAAVVLCGIMLFWAKEYRDEDKKWAPWFFEKDLSGILLLVWAVPQIVINLIVMLLTARRVQHLLDDTMSENFRVTVTVILVFFLHVGAAGLVALTIKSDRSHLWLEKMHFMPRMLLEEVMLVAPKLICSLIVIGWARLWGFSIDNIKYHVRRDLIYMFQDGSTTATVVAIPFVVGVVGGVVVCVVGGVLAVCIAGLFLLLEWTLEELGLRRRI